MRIVFRFPDGGTAARTPDSLALRRDGDTPADSLELGFSAGTPLLPGEPVAVRVERDGVLLFSGVVDEHRTVYAANGRRETFSCRSLAARMIDSEALPGVLQNPSLRLMEQRFLRPLDLSAGTGDRAVKRGSFPVEKGVSVWQAVSDFARDFLRARPRCHRDGTVDFAPVPARVLALPAPTEAEITRLNYGAVRSVAVQNTHSGMYTTVYVNPRAEGIFRTRCLSAGARTAPRALIAAGERGRLRVRVVCAGYFDGDPGDTVAPGALPDVREPLAVDRVRYTLDARGERCEIELLRKETDDVAF